MERTAALSLPPTPTPNARSSRSLPAKAGPDRAATASFGHRRIVADLRLRKMQTVATQQEGK